MAEPTIFVSVASYRDPDTPNTLRDLFAKAARPERVVAGVCWQLVPGEDDDCRRPIDLPPGLGRDHVRDLTVHARDSRGVCWARARTRDLWDGEDHVFQIDSHMRFTPGWDRVLLDMLAACPSDRPVLSTYPLPFDPPDRLAPDALVRILPKGFDDHGVLLQRSIQTPVDEAPRRPEATAFVGAGMLFAPADALVRDVPYDPHIYFQGEEITLAARLFTHGWDLFTPNRVVAYHDYRKRPERPRHWSDNVDWGRLNDLSCQRVRHLLGMQADVAPEALEGLDRHGLGTARRLHDYEAFSGIDFRLRLIGERFPADPVAGPAGSGRRAARRATFEAIWSQNGWRSDESRSGPGATMAQTGAIRGELPRLLARLGVEVLGDAGCGDLNWMRHASGDLRLYLGFDIVGDLVEELRREFRDRRTHAFWQADVVSDPLPRCDAILCRDVLTHLSPDAVLEALARFKASGSRHLIATTHSGRPTQFVRDGGWQPLDLTAAPFHLPPPRLRLDEGLRGSSKALGVWAMADLP